MTTTADLDTSIRRSRFEVPRTRGALSGLLLVLLGAWAGLVPFIGPYFDFGFTPAPDDTWNWTLQRFYMNVLPGLAVFIGGWILLLTANRAAASLGGWLAAAGGAWLVVGSPLSGILATDPGTPDPAATVTVQTLELLFYFYAVGVVIVLIAAAAIGRLSVIGVRDVRAAERRQAEEDRYDEEQRLAEEQRRVDERRQLTDEEELVERRRAEAAEATQPPTGPTFARPVVTEAPRVTEAPPVADPRVATEPYFDPGLVGTDPATADTPADTYPPAATEPRGPVEPLGPAEPAEPVESGEQPWDERR